ncbi:MULTISPECIES: FeoA family protein [unclassified Moorena]|uniref:FeoA family protein n=1 Tax=unclassified Moorena TaxID=2683338 RepID=UPI00140071D2|nr:MULTISPECIES: FeoA family protein [unclassified Moorena]NEO15434.1 ferrous iron transport protein A [Moorena sp. SIO3E8]NEQ02542.1 ferrous iron transport protein A [Moorena sp. SIO3F7]
MTLAELKPGKLAIIEKVQIGLQIEGLANRLEAIGIIPDRQVQVLRSAWFGGPLHIRVGSTTEVAIRRQEASMIVVNPVKE